MLIFLNYFEKTWICKYPPKLRSYYNLPKQLISRTNNALERYNRRIGEKFNFPPPQNNLIDTGFARRMQILFFGYRKHKTRN